MSGMEALHGPRVRKSLPLTDRDITDLEKLRTSQVHRDALAALSVTTLGRDSSEASLLHAVLEAGLRAVRERVERDGYADIAAQQDAAARKTSARRRRPSWAEEE